MIAAWLDANVIERFVTGAPAPLADRARRLMARAEAGELLFRVRPVVIAEVAWVLGTETYRYTRREIADVVIAFIRGGGIAVDETDAVLETLETMAERNVSFVDAYLAVCARLAAEPVCTFDADFKRLGVELLS